MLFMMIVPVFLTIAPVLLYQVVLFLCKKRSAPAHYLWTYITMFYIWMVFSVAGIGSVWDIVSKGGWIETLEQARTNFLPFQSEGISTYCLNVIMLMPLGFLLPYIWKNFRNPLKVTFTGFFFSALIEFSQLPTNRLADIDDLLMNTLGTVLGYAVWKMIGKYFFNRNESRRTLPLGKREPVVYLSLAWLCNFLLYNWKWFV